MKQKTEPDSSHLDKWWVARDTAQTSEHTETRDKHLGDTLDKWWAARDTAQTSEQTQTRDTHLGDTLERGGG